MPRRRGIFAFVATGWLLVGLGCGAGTVDVQPAWPEGARSGIAVVRGPEGLRLAAVEQAAFRYDVTSPEPVQVYLLTYDVPLVELGLEEGPLEVAEGGTPSVPLPRPAGIHVADGGGGANAFAAETDLPADLADLRLAAVPARVCGDAGGCFAPRAGDEVLVCRTPCPPLEAPAPPEPPTAPRLTPCPEGWGAVPAATPDDVAECTPFDRMQACADGTIQIPGTESCRRVGARCPDTGWPEQIAAGDVVTYVRANAAPGGDGTASAPLNSLADLPTYPGQRHVVVLGPGRYRALADAGPDLVVQGTCVDETELQALNPRPGAQVMLRDLDFTGGNLGTEGSVTAEGVRFGRRVGTRLLAPLEASDCAFESTNGFALDVREGGQALVRRSRLDGGLAVRGATSTASVSDTLVMNATNGIEVYEGGAVNLSRVLVVDGQFTGAYAEGAGSRLRLRDVVVRAAPGRESRVLVREGADLDAERIVVSGANSVGISVAFLATASIRDAVVRDVGPDREDDKAGMPVQILAGADVTLERVHLARGRTAGLVVGNANTRAVARDVRVVEVAGEVSTGGEGGHGVYVIDEGKLEAERLRIQRAHGLGLLVDNDAWVEGTDLWVQDVLPRDSNQAFGRGVEVGGTSLFDMQRVRVENAKNIGFHVLDVGSRANIFDLVVSGTSRSECFEFSCNAGIADGLTVNLQASIQVRRFRLENNEQIGLRIVNESPTILRNGLIRGNAIGAQVIDDDFDDTDLVTSVRYEDNDETFSFLAE